MIVIFLPIFILVALSLIVFYFILNRIIMIKDEKTLEITLFVTIFIMVSFLTISSLIIFDIFLG